MRSDCLRVLVLQKRRISNQCSCRADNLNPISQYADTPVSPKTPTLLRPRLSLHPTETKIVHVDIDGFEFLGYRFIKHRRFPRQKSLAKLKETIRSKTKRTNGNSLQAVIVNVNRTLRGWYEYFKHRWRSTFPELDGWIRMRLRSILRNRTGRRGRGHELDHHRYPNAFFAGHGLFSLAMAHACESQSCYK